MKAGIDIGYYQTKVTTEKDNFSFLSVTGTLDQSEFNVSEQSDLIIEPNGMAVRLVGESAIYQSTFVNRFENADWIDRGEYYYLMLAALSKVSQANWVNLDIITGLPVGYYEKDRALRLKSQFIGEHKTFINGRKQIFKVRNCKVIPQPFGTALSESLQNNGQWIDNKLFDRVGIVDIGGHTVNILSINRLREISDETRSINIGAWKIIRTIKPMIERYYSDDSFRDHEIAEMVKSRKIYPHGNEIDIGREIDLALTESVNEILSVLSQYWKSTAKLQKILITGGGAHLLGKYIKKQFKQAVIVKNPVFANSIGYWKYANRIYK